MKKDTINQNSGVLPKISIITITKNLFDDHRENLFKACMESVHNQTYKNIEHIIIDGASTDGSLSLIKEYESKGWCKVYSEKDDGVDDAYNKGTAKANGKYIAWMNSDDAYYDNNIIAECVETLEKNEADYCYGKQVALTRQGEKKGEFVPKIENFYKDMPFSHQTLIVKKDTLEYLGGYDTSCKIGGDYFLVLQLILNDCKGIYVDKYVSRYTLGGFSGSWENKYRVYTCTTILAKRMTWMYKQFYPNIDEDHAHYIYLNGENYWAYPKFFLLKLIRFMIEKKLKNFDYNKFINYINSIITQCPAYGYLDGITPTTTFHPKNKKYYLFNRINLLSIEHKAQKVWVKMFGFIPILKIKEKNK